MVLVLCRVLRIVQYYSIYYQHLWYPHMTLVHVPVQVHSTVVEALVQYHTSYAYAYDIFVHIFRSPPERPWT